MRIVGIGGTQRPGSSSERALQVALTAAREAGADIECFAGPLLVMPLYNPSERLRTGEAQRLIDAVRSADGLVLSSPSYHGTVSGLVKNALDYVEDTASDERPYFQGCPVGCIAVGSGWQGAGNTLRTLRDVVHSLRGMPTPYGAVVNSALRVFADGECVDGATRESLSLVGRQVVEMAGVLSVRTTVTS